MEDARLYQFLQRQIPVFITLSVLPGLGYVFLGWLNNTQTPAIIWYFIVIVHSIWGWLALYRDIDLGKMSENQRMRWYRHCSIYFYTFFLLWTSIFLLYVGEADKKLHYIAIFTEIGASIVASSLLSSDRRLYMPSILILMIPLITYFFFISEWFGYVLTLFAITLTWFLLYVARSSNKLLTQANYQAMHDSLTGLYSRQFILEFLQKRLNSLNESGEFSFLLLIDLDYFKNINDSLGHDIGDKLLQSVVFRLQQHTHENCKVARLGGDEFIVVGRTFSDHNTAERAAKATAEVLVASLKETYHVDLHHLYISASIGVSILSRQNGNAHNFIKEADIAMYEVKANGRDGYLIFNQEISKRVNTHLEVERLLHFALENNEITLHYQAQTDRFGQIVGAESLARWSNSTLGEIPPTQFIPIAEQTGLIIELGLHILETGFKTLRNWRDQGIYLEQFSINISMRQFTHLNFLAQIEMLLNRHLDDELCNILILEITESIVAEDVSRVIQTMNKLKELGIRFSMDDFGTGYSSLSYLNQLPLNEIKIDRSFITALDGNLKDRAMVITILNMANNLNLNIVAEGVETVSQLNFLLRNNCHKFQGHLHSKALHKEQFENLYLRQAKHLGASPVQPSLELISLST
jgi:diguanylate cyclase